MDDMYNTVVINKQLASLLGQVKVIAVHLCKSFKPLLMKSSESRDSHMAFSLALKYLRDFIQKQ